MIATPSDAIFRSSQRKECTRLVLQKNSTPCRGDPPGIAISDSTSGKFRAPEQTTHSSDATANRLFDHRRCQTGIF